jgi:hypothetical protein
MDYDVMTLNRKLFSEVGGLKEIRIKENERN